MIGKVKVENPQLKIDYNNNYELSFPVKDTSKFAVKQIMNGLQKNEKELSLTLDYFKKSRTLDQNALLWGLLTEFALDLNGGRKGNITEEDLYIKYLTKYGVATFVLVQEEAVKSLQQAYRDVIIVDKGLLNGKMYVKCKCIMGSSNYDTAQMADLIDGILDEMAEAGIETTNKNILEQEWRANHDK